mmetsp:Transcript_24417/g.77029  ORF Transcript_24417/g.77029 Transcript_24417/m.77029 type:complete len:216 (+) Transcript_24417:429-1076(+)
MRLDARKMLRSCRRPWPQRESTMGPWKKVIRVLSQLSVLTNVALMTVLETLVTDVSPLTRVLVAVAVEHLLLLLKDCVRSFIPDIPEKVKVELQRATYQLQTLATAGILSSHQPAAPEISPTSDAVAGVARGSSLPLPAGVAPPQPLASLVPRPPPGRPPSSSAACGRRVPMHGLGTPARVPLKVVRQFKRLMSARSVRVPRTAHGAGERPVASH